MSIRNLKYISDTVSSVYWYPNIPKKEYQWVEYLQSNGNQWIDTNVSIKSNTRVLVDLEFDSAFGYNMMYGAWATFSMALRAELNVCCASGGTNTQDLGLPVESGMRYLIDQRPGTITMSGVSTSFGSSSNSPSDRHILMFAASDASTGNNPYAWSSYGQGKIYNFKIYEGNALVRDFYPVVRHVDGTLGMYDIVNGQFYPNLGSGSFTRGNFCVSVDWGNTWVNEIKSYTGSNGSNDQWNTGIYFNPETDWMEVRFRSTKTNQNGMILANSNTYNHFWFYNYQDGSGIHLYLQNNGSQIDLGSIPLDQTWHTMRWYNKQFIMDGVVKGTDTRTLHQCESPLYIASWGSQYYFRGEFEYIKIWQNGQLVRFYIPAIDDDSFYGFIEVINNEFTTDGNSSAFSSTGITVDNPSRVERVAYKTTSMIYALGKTVTINTGDSSSSTTYYWNYTTEAGTYPLSLSWSGSVGGRTQTIPKYSFFKVRLMSSGSFSGKNYRFGTADKNRTCKSKPS